MNKPILNVVYLSLACMTGFIGGVFFGGPYTQNVVVETISKYSDFQNLMSWYTTILDEKSLIESLNEIENIDDIEKTISQRKHNGMNDVEIFREQAERLKKNAANPDVIIELEASVNEMAKSFEQSKP